MARIFNGTTQALSTSSTIDLTGVTTLTVAFWLWWTAFAADDKLAMESSTNFNSNAGGILVDPDDSGSTNFALAVRGSAATGNNYFAFARPTAGAWHHYAAAFNLASWATSGTATGAVSAVYVDGIAATNVNTGSQGDAAPSGFGNFTWYFMSRATTSLFGAGRLCEVALFPGTILSPVEARTLAAGTPASAVRPGAPRYYWPLAGDTTSDPATPRSSTKLLLAAAPTLIAHAPVTPAMTARRRIGKAPASPTVAFPWAVDLGHRLPRWTPTVMVPAS